MVKKVEYLNWTGKKGSGKISVAEALVNNNIKIEKADELRVCTWKI